MHTNLIGSGNAVASFILEKSCIQITNIDLNISEAVCAAEGWVSRLPTKPSYRWNVVDRVFSGPELFSIRKLPLGKP